MSKAKLGRVQRLEELQVLGALRTMPNSLLDAHAGFMPINMRIQRICIKAAAHIAAMPETQPLFKLARKAARFVKRHCTPLHYIMKALEGDLKEVERLDVVRKPPG